MTAQKLLRDVQTQEWLKADGSFTRNVAEAAEVSGFLEANRICRPLRGKRRLELVVRCSGVKDVVHPME
jgi:hypothetical protein